MQHLYFLMSRWEDAMEHRRVEAFSNGSAAYGKVRVHEVVEDGFFNE